MAAGKGKKDKVPLPGAKGERTTAFYSRNKWKAVLQEAQLDLAGRTLGPRGGLIVTAAVSTNTRVVSLDLSHNELGDEGAVAVANMLRANTRLQQLNLSHNNMTDAGGIALASAFIPNVSSTGQPGQWNRTLLSLNLMGNHFTDDTLLALSNAAACQRGLTFIDLSYNEVGPRGTKCLARAFQRNPLCVYRLAANAMSDEGTQYLCEALQRYGGKSQTSLNLYGNGISYAGAAAVGSLLAHTSTVQDVSLAGNTIGFKGAQALQKHLTDFAVLAACPLRALNLSDNWLGDEGAASVAAIVAADLPFLERLDVSDNRLTDGGVTTLFTAALRNTHLQLLSCEGNRMGSRAVEAAVRLIRESNTLKALNVSHCMESAEHRRTLTFAGGERDGLNLELGPDPMDGGAASAEERDRTVGKALEAKMTEYLQTLADQAAQKEQENATSKKRKKLRSAGG